ncbi:MAG: pyridoxal 5'-phosphate synthase glutaminase subunit PdxT [Candidatus Methanospirareceae archaeon]
MKIGVIAIQGNVAEHVSAFEKALAERGERGEVVWIKHQGMVANCDALAIPGGESTTIGRLMQREGIFEELVLAVEVHDIPILGTCAGLVLLASGGDDEVTRTGQPLLSLMDITVKRNAFGRQRESFEMLLPLSIFEEPFPAVFIRAPAITRTGEDVEILATVEEQIVAAQQGKLLALAFHPELTEDRRIHHYFLDLV